LSSVLYVYPSETATNKPSADGKSKTPRASKLYVPSACSGYVEAPFFLCVHTLPGVHGLGVDHTTTGTALTAAVVSEHAA
jgi:hypothetical protein